MSDEIEYYPIEFVDIETTDELIKLREEDFPVYVNCYIENCPPCAGIKSTLDESKFNIPLKIYRVDLSKDLFLQQKCRLMSAPAFIILDKYENQLIPKKQKLIKDLFEFTDFFNVIINDDF